MIIFLKTETFLFTLSILWNHNGILINIFLFFFSLWMIFDQCHWYYCYYEGLLQAKSPKSANFPRICIVRPTSYSQITYFPCINMKVALYMHKQLSLPYEILVFFLFFTFIYQFPIPISFKMQKKKKNPDTVTELHCYHFNRVHCITSCKLDHNHVCWFSAEYKESFISWIMNSFYIFKHLKSNLILYSMWHY